MGWLAAHILFKAHALCPALCCATRFSVGCPCALPALELDRLLLSWPQRTLACTRINAAGATVAVTTDNTMRTMAWNYYDWPLESALQVRAQAPLLASIAPPLDERAAPSRRLASVTRPA
jgi:hypothetical protein